MKFEIFFTVNDYTDSFIVSGETIEEIRNKTKNWLNSRGLTLGNYSHSIELTS